MKTEIIDAEYSLVESDGLEPAPVERGRIRHIAGSEVVAVENSDGTVSVEQQVLVYPRTSHMLPFSVFMGVLTFIGIVLSAEGGAIIFFASFLGLPVLTCLIVLYASRPRYKRVR